MTYHLVLIWSWSYRQGTITTTTSTKNIFNGQAPEVVISQLKAETGTTWTDKELLIFAYSIALPDLRKKYAVLNIILGSALVLSGVLKTIPMLQDETLHSLLAFVLPLLNIFLAILVFRFNRFGYMLSILFMAFSLSSIIRVAQAANLYSPAGIYFLVFTCDIALCAVLSTVLMLKLFPRLTFRGALRS